MQTHTPAQAARADKRVAAQTDTGPEPPPPAPQTGIFGAKGSGPLPPTSFEFASYRTGKIGGDYATVYTGLTLDATALVPSDHPQAAYALVYNDGDDSVTSVPKAVASIRLPIGTAMPTIMQAHDSLLLIQTSQGQKLTFDTPTRQTSFGSAPQITAPALTLQLVPGASLSLDTATATLTAGSPAVPLEGETLTFTAGKTSLCSATTDAQGVASCKYSLTGVLAAALAPLGYTVSFAGDQSFTHFAGNADGLYQSVTAQGSFVTVGGLGLASRRAHN